MLGFLSWDRFTEVSLVECEMFVSIEGHSQSKATWPTSTEEGDSRLDMDDCCELLRDMNRSVSMACEQLRL